MKSIMMVGLVFFTLVGVLHAETYSVSEQASYFGWLDQYSLDNSTYHFVGNEACVPTSSTNAMTYLQNLAPQYFGTALTGTTYANWISTDALLITPAYMDTKPSSGTYYDHLPYALNKYIVTDKGFTAVQFSGIFPADYWGTGKYAKPGYITDGNPTSAFFLGALGANKATLFSILYNNGGGGHELLATGLNWTDANNDGIIQQTENAALSFVDPLDPATYNSSGQPTAGPKITQGQIWYDEVTNCLELAYNQYHGGLPYSDDYLQITASIDTVFAIETPLPGTASLFLLGGCLLVVWRFRGKFRHKSVAQSSQPNTP